MGFININNLPGTVPIPGGEMTVYLTDYGRETLLNTGFGTGSISLYFTVSDSDTNYVGNQNLNQLTNDVTGDYTDIVYSLSKNVIIKNELFPHN
jgi:hypothetical protein